MAYDQSISGRAKARAGGGKFGSIRAFFLIFLIIGAGLAYPFLVRPIQRMMAAKSWEAHPCAIVSSHIESSRSSNGVTYRVRIRYRYTIEGRNFESSQYGFADDVWSSGYKSKQEITVIHLEQTRFVMSIRDTPLKPCCIAVGRTIC